MSSCRANRWRAHCAKSFHRWPLVLALLGLLVAPWFPSGCKAQEPLAVSPPATTPDMGGEPKYVLHVRDSGREPKWIRRQPNALCRAISLTVRRDPPRVTRLSVDFKYESEQPGVDRIAVVVEVYDSDDQLLYTSTKETEDIRLRIAQYPPAFSSTQIFVSPINTAMFFVSDDVAQRMDLVVMQFYRY